MRACDPVEVLNNGSAFYAAELAEIAKTTQTIHFEAYIFQRGRVAQDFINALCERARSVKAVKDRGVKVTVLTPEACRPSFHARRLAPPLRPSTQTN